MEVDFDPVALNGEADPNTGGTFAAFNQAVINNSGEFAFVGSLSLGGGVTLADNEGIWSGTPGAFSLIAREGSAAVGVATGDYDLFSPLVNTLQMDDAGRVGFRGRLKGTPGGATDNIGVWVESPAAGTLVLAAREGDDAPGVFSDSPTDAVPGLFFNDGPNLGGFANNGDSFFKGSLLRVGTITTANDTGYWHFVSGVGTSLLAREGDVAGGTGGTYGQVLLDAKTSANATPIFTSNITGGGGGQGIFTGLAPTVRARKFDVAPGTAGATFSSFDVVTVNDSGFVAFRGTLTPGTGVPAVDPTNNTGVWTITPGGVITLLAREGSTATGTADLWDTFGSVFVSNDDDVTFDCSLDTLDRAIYSTGSGSLALVAREGGAAPFPGGPGVFTSVGRPVVNNVGQILFGGTVDTGHPDITSANDTGLWQTNMAGGGLARISQEGNVLVAGASTSTIAGFALNTQGCGVFGRGRAMDDTGTFVVGITAGSSAMNGLYSSFPALAIEIIASTDQEPPGLPGAEFDSIRPGPHVNSLGEAIFRAHLKVGVAGISPLDNKGIWSEGLLGIGMLEEVVRGMDVTDTGSVISNPNINPTFDNAGTEIFYSSLALGPGGVNVLSDNAIFATHSGALQTLIQESAPVPVDLFSPPVPIGATFVSVSSVPAGNVFGDVALRAAMRPLNLGLPIGDPQRLTNFDAQVMLADQDGDPFTDSISVIARQAQPAPGTSPAGDFDLLYSALCEPRINALGTLAFYSRLKVAGPITASTADTIWYKDADTAPAVESPLTLLAQGGDPAPGGGTMEFLSWPSISDTGLIAFHADLVGGGQEIIAGSPTPLGKVIGTGDPTPGLAGTTILSLKTPSTNELGDITFGAELAGAVTPADKDVILTDVGGPLSVVARTGTTAPGGPAGATFALLKRPVIGDSGIAFVGEMAGGGVTPGTDSRGLWAQTSGGGGLVLAARAGQIVEAPAGSGTMRTISNILLAGDDPRWEQTVFAPTGELVFWLEFTDGATAAARIVIP